jgi:hypothetical protein
VGHACDGPAPPRRSHRCALAAADFSARFDELKAAASPAQLYALLFDLPKGGDLHNHSGGSERPEWILAVCTDPARNGGDTFYTRARLAGQPDAKDPATLLVLQQSRRTLVEVNLISNRLLEYTPDLSQHPFPEYLRTGVPVCLNTDDRGMWDSNLTDEYYTAVTQSRLSWDEIVQLGRHSLAHSFVQPAVKAKLLADYDSRVAAFERRYAAGSVADALARLAAVKPVAYGYTRRTWGLEFRRGLSLRIASSVAFGENTRRRRPGRSIRRDRTS